MAFALEKIDIADQLYTSVDESFQDLEIDLKKFE